MINMTDEQIQEGLNKINKREDELTAKLFNISFSHNKSFDTLLSKAATTHFPENDKKTEN